MDFDNQLMFKKKKNLLHYLDLFTSWGEKGGEVPTLISKPSLDISLIRIPMIYNNLHTTLQINK